ncbi:MAG: hypothetical protein A2176_02955 [Spirochaetes bacterium RBG_13_51_14]|nr:MAG: hypothetical protein A2176_02955 [Spirochaetes bacterium RBG_13_51_14]
MAHINKYSKNLLELNVVEGETSIYVMWKGKSVDRDPSSFTGPILEVALENCIKNNKKLILDFQELEFMNSSTITPVSKIIEIGKNRSMRITILYQKSKNWQELNFSALRIFETKDKRIEIKGL